MKKVSISGKKSGDHGKAKWEYGPDQYMTDLRKMLIYVLAAIDYAYKGYSNSHLAELATISPQVLDHLRDVATNPKYDAAANTRFEMYRVQLYTLAKVASLVGMKAGVYEFFSHLERTPSGDLPRKLVIKNLNWQHGMRVAARIQKLNPPRRKAA